MKLGDTVWCRGNMRPLTGLLRADGRIDTFSTRDFPELAEMYEYKYDYPDGTMRMAIPLFKRKNGLVPYIVARPDALSRIQSRQRSY